ncbi:MAG TPA: alpha/beta fold hydrolase [Mycobacteriales bacterium]|nr:alpha/beta fold hydrolase [Mycobacteriales bacterium]
MALIDAAGITVGYEVAGSGPPLVLLHGGLCDRRVWREQVELLAADFTVIAWDTPGCGESSDPETPYNLADYATCLAEFLSLLEATPAHVVGHSWGGGLALQVAADHPHAVRSLVLIGGYAGWKGSLSAAEVERRLAKALEAADLVPERFDPRTVPGLFSDRIAPDRARELADVMAETRPPGTRAMAVAFAEADLRDRLGDIAVPTLLLYGADDVRAPAEVAEQLHANIPGSTLVLLPDLGHESYLEDPETVAAAVRDFIAY